MHVSEAIWCSEVREKTEELQHGLRELSRPCPEGVPVTGVGSWVCLLCVDKPGELDRISDEKDGCVYQTLVISLSTSTMNILLKTLRMIVSRLLIRIRGQAMPQELNTLTSQEFLSWSSF